MENKKIYITLFIISIIFLGIGGTLAALTTSSTLLNISQIRSGNLTMTVDGGGSENVSLFPSTCTSEHAIKKTIKASAVNTSGGKVSFSIGMNVAVLSNDLKRSTMKYALSTSSDSCTDGLIANGNFSKATVGSDIWIVKNDYDNITNSGNTYTKTYYLYIWLDAVEAQNVSGSISVNMKGTSSNNPNLTTEAVKSVSLYEMIKGDADTTTTIDFSKTSRASNTNGIYTTTDTDSGNPVYYYRGNVDNHVLFANFCWRIVRTTETGGVKLIYNGVQKDVYETVAIEKSSYTDITNDATYPYTFDNFDKTWTSTNKINNKTGTITFSVNEAGDYVLSYVMSSEVNRDKALFYKNGTMLEEHSGTEEGQIILSGLTTSDVIKVEYTKNSWDSSGHDTVTFSIGKAMGNPIKSCNNTSSNSQITTSSFNESYDSHADVGYMYGTRYIHKNLYMPSLSSSIVFGSDITYANGIYTLKGTYTLTEPSNFENEVKTVVSKYHYTCFTSGDTCEKVDYIFTTSGTDCYYFELSGGKNHLDILKEMLEVNINNSIIKNTIDTWYENNMTDYTSQLEDTVFCNDRSYDISKSGWNKDYSNYSAKLDFGAYTRLYENKTPTLKCQNTKDKFTVEASNGNGTLTYPIGLITADEIAYAGAVYNQNNSSFYLYTGQDYWALSSAYFDIPDASGFALESSGSLVEYNIKLGDGVRPSVSLQPGVGMTDGSGTATDPFIVE